MNCCYAPRLLFNPCLVRFSIHHPSVNPCTRNPYLQAYAHTPLAIRYPHHSPTTHISFHSAHNHSTGTAAAIPPSSPSSPSNRASISHLENRNKKNPACTFSILHHQYNNSHVHITFVLFTRNTPFTDHSLKQRWSTPISSPSSPFSRFPSLPSPNQILTTASRSNQPPPPAK